MSREGHNLLIKRYEHTYGRPPGKMNLHVQPFTVTQDTENNTD